MLRLSLHGIQLTSCRQGVAELKYRVGISRKSFANFELVSDDWSACLAQSMERFA
jgi:hypothetical protein